MDQKQLPIESSIAIHRKPFSDLTNRRHVTQNPNRLTPKTPTPDDWVRVGNRITRSSRRNTILKTNSKTKETKDAAAVSVYASYLEKTENEVTKSKNIMEEDICTPLSGTEIHYNEKQIVDGEGNSLQSKSSTDPHPNNKRRKYSSAEICGKYVVPQDFIDQQRAYYKEIDEYELEVEEVENQSEDEE